MAKVYIVQAGSGSYEDKSWWIVNAWSAERLAKKTAEHMNNCSQLLWKEAGEDPMPHEDDQYDAWKERRTKRLMKWRRKAGDEHMDEYEQTYYNVAAVPLKTVRRK